MPCYSNYNLESKIEACPTEDCRKLTTSRLLESSSNETKCVNVLACCVTRVSLLVLCCVEAEVWNRRADYYDEALIL